MSNRFTEAEPAASDSKLHGIFTHLKAENVHSILSDNRACKLIYLSHGDKSEVEEAKQFAQSMAQQMGTEPLMLHCDN